MTGRFDVSMAVAGAKTFRYRQSSEPIMPLGKASWMHGAAKLDASRAPDQDRAADGGRHRSGPSGGAA
jgi:hypothetical protein